MTDEPSQEPVVSRKAAFYGKVLLLIVGTLIGLVVAEVGLRVARVAFPLPYTTDPNCGTLLQPGFHAWFHKEGHGYVEVNQWGFRDSERTTQKPDNVLRIAVLGDSYAEALQVMDDETFWAAMEHELQQAGVLPGKRIEVLNFGISGFGTAQELLVLRHHVWQFDPDVVLLLFTSGNDVRNNSKRLEPNQTKPFFLLQDDGLVEDVSFRQHPDYLKAQSGSTRAKVWLINRFRLLQLANEIRNRPPRVEGEVENAGSEAGLDDRIFQQPQDEAWQEAWDITERLLVTLHNETQQQDVLFVVALGNSAIQVDPNPAVRKACQDRLGVDDLLYPDRRVEAIGERCGFPVLSLTMPMREYAEEHQAYLHGFENTRMGTGHWNAEGHALAGRLLAERLGEILAPTETPSPVASEEKQGGS